MNKKKTLKKKNVKVGEVIGIGAYGCVINPSIILINTQDPYSIVSKIIETKYAEKELDILQDLQLIDPKGLYTSVLIEFSPLTRQIFLKQCQETQDDIKQCNKGKSTFQNISIINTTNIGLSLENHLKFYDKPRLTEKEIFIKNDIHNIKLNFREIVCNLLEGLNHFHKNNIIHRDIKPENIAFKQNEEKFTVLNDNTEYNKYLCKYLDFGISFNFGIDNRKELYRELNKKIKPHEYANIEGEIMIREIINNPNYIISTAKQADIFINKLFSGTVMFMPVEYFAILIKMIRKFPELINKGTYTHNFIYSTVIGNKPYSEEGVIDCLVERCMKPFGGAFNLDEYKEINEIVTYLLSHEDFENYFFKYHKEKDESVFLPFVFYQDYYALGLTLNTILKTLKINDKRLEYIIKELYDIHIFERMNINLEEMIYRIRKLS